MLYVTWFFWILRSFTDLLQICFKYQWVINRRIGIHRWFGSKNPLCSLYIVYIAGCCHWSRKAMTHSLQLWGFGSNMATWWQNKEILKKSIMILIVIAVRQQNLHFAALGYKECDLKLRIREKKDKNCCWKAFSQAKNDCSTFYVEMP